MPSALVEEVRDAHRLLKGRTKVTGIDAVECVRHHPDEPKYLDPPYFEKGDKLFRQRMTLADHVRLADALRSASNWVLSYDRSPVIEELYRWARVHTMAARYSVNGAKKAWAHADELLIVPPI